MAQPKSKGDYIRSRLSYADREPGLRRDQGALARTGSIRAAFETERCPHNAAQLRDIGKSEAQRRREAARLARPKDAARGSAMIKRQQPRPIPRPPQCMALGPDRAAFTRQLQEEHRRAQEELSRDAAAARADIMATKPALEREAAMAPKLQKQALVGDVQGAEKEAYKTLRRMERIGDYCERRGREFFRKHGRGNH